MNNDITETKRILNSIKYSVDENDWFEMEGHNLKPLLDYITNLQEENEQLQIDVNNCKEENEFLKLNNPEMNIRHFDMIKENKRKINNLRAENKKLNKSISIMEKYLELIHDLGYDYDGLNHEHDLKGLIDEMVRLASLGRACNITKEVYVDGKGKSLNILGEELKEDKE